MVPSGLLGQNSCVQVQCRTDCKRLLLACCNPVAICLLQLPTSQASLSAATPGKICKEESTFKMVTGEDLTPASVRSESANAMPGGGIAHICPTLEIIQSHARHWYIPRAHVAETVDRRGTECLELQRLPTLPSSNSRDAPPPVEMWLILSARPAFSTAATESPPPMMVMVPWTSKRLRMSHLSTCSWPCGMSGVLAPTSAPASIPTVPLMGCLNSGSG